jgi:hypothetical protein
MRRGLGSFLHWAIFCVGCAVYTPDLAHQGSASDGAGIGGSAVGQGGFGDAGGPSGGSGGTAAAGSDVGGGGAGGSVVLDAGSDDGPAEVAMVEEPPADTADVLSDISAEVSVDSGCGSPCILKAALLHRYSFSGTGTRATDSVGQAHGTLVNATLTGTGTVVLAGGTTDQYVDLPNGIVRSLNNATFEAWVTWNGGTGWQRLFDFGNSNGAEGTQSNASTSLYLTPQGGGPTVMLVAFKRSDQMGVNETRATAAQGLPTGTPAHLAVVVDATNTVMTLYRNGVVEGSVAFRDSLSLLNDVNNWLGRSQYVNNDSFGGTIDEFRIYAIALSRSDVQASFAAGPNAPFLN